MSVPDVSMLSGEQRRQLLADLVATMPTEQCQFEIPETDLTALQVSLRRSKVELLPTGMWRVKVRLTAEGKEGLQNVTNVPAEKDYIQEFIDDHIEEGASRTLDRESAWYEYKEWHQKTYPGTRISSKKDLEARITARFGRPHKRNGWMKVGMRLPDNLLHYSD